MTEDDLPTPLDQALEWCVRLHESNVTQSEHDAFAQWLATDPAHPPAWLRAKQVWSAAGLAGDAYTATRMPRRSTSRRYKPALASAAAVVLALAALTMFSPARWADYRTDVAQVRSWTLEDGSTVQLAPQTAMDVRYNEGERRIHLYGGEAWFKVAANPARPFIVSAAKGEVRALGTAFDVRLVDEGVEVTVTEHRVRVSHATKQTEASEGQAVHYGASGIGQLRSVDLKQRLAWREQRLIFEDEPLAQVIQRLQPYSRAHLLLTDASLGQFRVTAAVNAPEADAALKSLQIILPIRITQVGPWLTLVRPQTR
ncbi:FecR family protein [Pseudomonas putida]|uniref:FecR family protein n=1 Tax=Pseudomonas putida TaxID=303 RepID=UPI0039060982